MTETIYALRSICAKEEKEDRAVLAYRWLSAYLTKLFLYLPLSPNHITLLAVAVALAGALLLVPGNAQYTLGGALLFQLYFLLDCVDGSVARYRGLSSLSGRYLDGVIQYVTHFALFIGLTYGVYNSGFHSPWVFAFGFLTGFAAVFHKAIYAVIYQTASTTRVMALESGADYPRQWGDLKRVSRNSGSETLAIRQERPVIVRMVRPLLVSFNELYSIIFLLIVAVADVILPPVTLGCEPLRYTSLFLFVYGTAYAAFTILRLWVIWTKGDVYTAYRELFL